MSKFMKSTGEKTPAQLLKRRNKVCMCLCFWGGGGGGGLSSANY